jgi:hypothetical protein
LERATALLGEYDRSPSSLDLPGVGAGGGGGPSGSGWHHTHLHSVSARRSPLMMLASSLSSSPPFDRSEGLVDLYPLANPTPLLASLPAATADDFYLVRRFVLNFQCYCTRSSWMPAAESTASPLKMTRPLMLPPINSPRIKRRKPIGTGTAESRDFARRVGEYSVRFRFCDADQRPDRHGSKGLRLASMASWCVSSLLSFFFP